MPAYAIRLPFDEVIMLCNTEQAAAPISVGVEDDDDVTQYIHTGYQTADARHDLRRAAVLAVKRLGRDYYADPSDAPEDPADDDAYIDGMIREIRPLEEED